MTIIRFSGYDGHIFQQMLPRLFNLVYSITDHERWNLYFAVPRIWDTYYPLGEATDLANELGNLLLMVNFHQEAILYFEKSIQIYGTKFNTLYKIALCHCLIGTFSKALPIIEVLQIHDSENEALQMLMEHFSKELKGK